MRSCGSSISVSPTPASRRINARLCFSGCLRCVGSDFPVVIAAALTTTETELEHLHGNDDAVFSVLDALDEPEV